LELIIYNQVEVEEIRPIEFNHTEIKAELAERLTHYNSLVYAESDIRAAKADRATLNKFKEAIETRRKEIKKSSMAPYEDFEARVKEIIKMIDQPISAIDNQIKTFEERVKAEKKVEIRDYYTETIGDLAKLLPLTKIWNEKWLNAAVTMKDIKGQINTQINVVKGDLKVITDLNSEFELQIKDTYLKGMNLSLALSEKTRLEDQKSKQDLYDKLQIERSERLKLERIEAEKAEAILIAQRAHERQLTESESIHKEPEVITVETEPDGHTLTKEGFENLEKIFAKPEPIPEVEQPKQIDFRVWATTEQLRSLKAFLLENSIKYGKVC